MARCWAHNTGTDIPAAYRWLTIVGNDVPLCLECCAQWRANVEDGTCYPPVRIVQIGD